MEPAPHRSSNARWLVGGALVAAAIVGLVTYAMSRPGSQAFYMTPSELAAASTSAAATYRLSGTVVPGSIERDGLTTAFTVTDGDTSIPVVTGEALPDTFRDRAEVVARGSFDGTRFAAAEVLAKCPSKFKTRA